MAGISVKLILFLKVAFVLHLRGITANTGATSSSATSYQPASGVEERWIAEEELHASSTGSQREIEQHIKKEKRGSKDPQPDDSFSERSWWDDDDEQEYGDQRDVSSLSNNSNDKRHKVRVWKNNKITKETQSASPIDKSSLSSHPNNNPLESEYNEEHPMRTDEWQLDIQLSRLFPKQEGELFTECYADSRTTVQTNDLPKRRRNSYRKRQVMQFAMNGYMKILEDESKSTDTTSSGGGSRRNKLKVGKWRIGHSGVAFDVPVTVNIKRKRGTSNDSNAICRATVLHYYADIHLNKFGERPRMFRGVITRDRHSSFLPPSFLRPVIGTFSAEGIGRDTADTSYKERAISMSRQQVINDARKEKP